MPLSDLEVKERPSVCGRKLDRRGPDRQERGMEAEQPDCWFLEEARSLDDEGLLEDRLDEQSPRINEKRSSDRALICMV